MIQEIFYFIISRLYLILAALLISSNGQHLELMADVISAVRRHYTSECVALLLPSGRHNKDTTYVQKLYGALASEIQDDSKKTLQYFSSTLLVKLLSKRAMPAVILHNLTLNISHDNTHCQYNRVLYVLTQEAILILQQFSTRISLSGPTWLVFSNSSLKLEELLKDIYIPFNCLFLVVLGNSHNNFSLTEVYQVNSTMPLQSAQLATRSPDIGLQWDNRSLYDRRNDLQGIIIKTATYVNPPFVEPINHGHVVQLGGMFGKVWHTIGNELNFSTDVYVPDDKATGSLSKNGSWNGMMGLLAAGKVDVAVADLTMTIHRVQTVDFTLPLIISRFCVFIQRPASTYEALANIVAPFSAPLWFTIQGVILGLAVFLSVVYHVRRRYGSNEDPLLTLPEALLYVFGIFCQQGNDFSPRSWSCRLVYWVAYMTAVVVFAAYAAALVSFLALQRVVPPFTTLKGMLKNGKYRLGVLPNTAHSNFFDQTTDYVMKEIYEKLFEKNFYPKSMLQGLNSVCENKFYAFMTSYHIALALHKNVTCNLMALRDASLPETLSIAITKRNPYLGIINYKLQQLRGSGMLKRIRDNEWPYQTEVSKSPWISVTIEAVKPMFSILTIGIGLAVLLMVLERQTRRLMHRTKLRGTRRRRIKMAI